MASLISFPIVLILVLLCHCPFPRIQSMLYFILIYTVPIAAIIIHRGGVSSSSSFFIYKLPSNSGVACNNVNLITTIILKSANPNIKYSLASLDLVYLFILVLISLFSHKVNHIVRIVYSSLPVNNIYLQVPINIFYLIMLS